MSGTGDYSIELSEDVGRHLSTLTARQRRMVVEAMEQQLRRQPTVPTRHRKPLRENPLASWQLRVGDLRVLYNVDKEQGVVLVVAVGVKVHNALFIDGKAYPL